MATVAGTIYLNGCNYQLQYDILGQSVENNTTTVRLYGVLNVTNNYVSWSRSSRVWVHYIESSSFGTYYSKGSHVLIQGDWTFTHNTNGELTQNIGYGISTTFINGVSSVDITFPTIPRQANITYAPNFNDEENPTINYSNPLGNSAEELKACISLAGTTDDISYRDVSKTSGTYTFELTESERNVLRNATTTSNNRTVKFFLRTKIGGTYYHSIVDRTFSIINGNPVFSNFDFEETNTTVKALTGSTKNNVININGYSNIKATISTTNKATSQKSATMSKYRFSIGDNSTDITYSDASDVSGTVNNATSGTYNVYAIDSRNNSTLVTKQATSVINYTPIALNKQNCSFVRDDNQVGQNAILALEGTFWNNNFGQVANSITSVTYQFKKTTDSTWTTGTTTITPTISNNNFSFTGYIASDNQDTTWDLDASYNVRVIVQDRLSTTNVELILNSAIPTLSLDKEGVGIMCAYDENLGGQLQVGGKIVSGAEILWKNLNPDVAFGTQTVTLNSSDYDVLEVFYYDFINSRRIQSSKLIKGENGNLTTNFQYNDHGYMGDREIRYVDDLTYRFAQGVSTIQADILTRSAANDWLIPIYIVGYKIGIN